MFPQITKSTHESWSGLVHTRMLQSYTWWTERGLRRFLSKWQLSWGWFVLEWILFISSLFRFSYAELRSFLNMFYEEEEREADRIRTKFLLVKRRLQRQLEALERKREGEEEGSAASESLCWMILRTSTTTTVKNLQYHNPNYNSDFQLWLWSACIWLKCCLHLITECAFPSNHDFCIMNKIGCLT